MPLKQLSFIDNVTQAKKTNILSLKMHYILEV